MKTKTPSVKKSFRITSIAPAFLLAALMASCPVEMRARTPIDEVLAKHSHWALNVDGEVGTLEILGGSGEATSSGGYEMTADVSWKGAAGTLQASADGLGLQYQVKLSILRGGVPVNLEGYVAQDSDAMMAGIVKGPGSKKLGAWHAELDDWMAEVRRLALAGRKIDAIKLYREKTGASLATAEDAVDALAASAAGAATPSSPPPPVTPPPSTSFPSRSPTADPHPNPSTTETCAVTVRVRGNVAMARLFEASIVGPDGSRRVERSQNLGGGTTTFDALPPGEYQVTVDTKADTAVTPRPARSTVRCADNARPTVEIELR